MESLIIGGWLAGNDGCMICALSPRNGGDRKTDH